VVQIHLDQEAANVGLEDRMDGVFLAGEDLLHRTDFPARDHIEVAVVDRAPGHRIGLVVVRNESEVQGLAPNRIQVVRTFFGGGDGLPQAVDLTRVLLEFFLGDVNGHVELRGLGAQFGLLLEHVQRARASRGLLKDVVGEQHLGNFAVGVGVSGLIQRGELGGRVSFCDQSGSEVSIDVGLDLLELREYRLRFHVVGLLLAVKGRELRASGAVVRALARDRGLESRLEGQERGTVLGHFGNAALHFLGIDFEIFNALLAGYQFLTEVQAFFVDGGDDDRRSPRAADRIETHHKRIGENAAEDEIKHGDGKNAIERNHQLVMQRLPGRTSGRTLFRFRRWSLKCLRCQRAPLVLPWSACPSLPSPWCRAPGA